MASAFKPPPEFTESEHPASAWIEWKQRFLIYAAASDLTSKTDTVQLATFLHVIGTTGIKIYNNLKLDSAHVLTDVVTAFDSYFKPYHNITHLSHLFFTAKQRNDQTIDQFILELNEKARPCEFGQLTDRLIRDVLICGIHDNELRQKLLSLSNPLLPEVSAMCRAFEQSKRQVAIMTPFVSSRDPAMVDELRITKNSPAARSSQRGSSASNTRSQKTCYRCGYSHNFGACPAYGKTCVVCKEKNHFAKRCPNKGKVSYLVQDCPNQSDEIAEEFLIGSIASKGSSPWFCTLSLHNKNINFKLDTGSDLNVIPLKLWKSWNCKPVLTAAKINATAYSGHKIPIVGKFSIAVTYNSKTSITEFVVTTLNAQPILGGPSCNDLGLIDRVFSLVTSSSDASAINIINEFKDVFSPTLGKLPMTYNITLKENAVPVVTPTRKLPLALLKPVQEVLQTMERNGVIAKVTKPTDWVNALLPITKGGKIRIALDPRPLNQFIKRQHHPIPLLNSILTSLRNCNVFTVLDARDAFWQMVLSESSSYLCTFGSPFGRYRFLRVPFGISSAPEFQQSTMDEICEGLDGTAAFFDDIIIAGRDLVEHNDRLRAFLTRARQYGLHLKSEKTQLAKESVNFVGHVISSKGTQPSNKNLNAINALSPPTSKEELKRFLGMAGFLRKFIPNFSDHTNYLRKLLSPNITWNWSPQAQNDFSILKGLINTAPVLAHFDPNVRLCLSVDASKHGLGAVLLQNGQPLAYASGKLSPAQTRYAQIEKELLAIVFGCVKFHFFTYGREISIETDHKPLLAIVKKPFDAISPRLQRLLLKLQNYTFTLTYTPGRYLYVADILSRSPAPCTVEQAVDNDELSVHHISAALKYHSQMHLDLIQATAKDPESQSLVQYIEAGWPKSIKCVPRNLKKFWNFRQELHVFDDLIYKGQRIFIPQTFQTRMLNRIHESHQGIVACKARARELIYWPGMAKQIEDLIRNCHACQTSAPKNRREPLMSHPIPDIPWSKLAADFFKVKNNQFLLIVDYFSKFAELLPMTNTTVAAVVIDALKSTFSRHGIPNELVSDNGPPFNSCELQKFALDWDFKLITSSPAFPQSNGQVERTVKTLKGQLIKCLTAGGDPYLVLLNYHSTPHDDLPVPSVLLMSRRLRTRLPGHPDNYYSVKPSPHASLILQDRQIRQKAYYDHAVRDLPPFKCNDPVYFEKTSGTWEPAVITGRASQPRSYWIRTPPGKLFRRNRKHLRPRANLILPPSTIP